MDERTVLEVKSLSKTFSGVKALTDFSFDLKEAEIHALIGENGAGKSTFCNILTGILQPDPDQGEVRLFGKKVEFNHPFEAINAGISMVYQERNLINHLTGAQNICLGSEPRSKVLLNEKQIEGFAEQISKEVGISVPLNVPVEKLGAGTKQLIEIMRALFHEPKLLILDEPTASIGGEEVETFLRFIKTVAREKKVSVIFISHKLDEVYTVADRISILVEGNKVRTEYAGKLDRQACITSMLKKDKIEDFIIKSQEIDESKPALKVGQCFYDGIVHHLNFTVHKKEVAGFYGLVGSGRTECAEVIFGLQAADKYDIEFNGVRIEKPIPAEMIQRGLIMTPEIRANGVFEDESLSTNICILFLKKLTKNILGLYSTPKNSRFADRILKQNGVKYSSNKQRIRELSGGNIQKTIIGRSIAIENLDLIILDEPTNGLDLGAKNDVYIQIRRIVEDKGKAVLFISSEIEELLKVCDRIYVFMEGSISAEFTRKDFSKKRILDAAFRKGLN